MKRVAAEVERVLDRQVAARFRDAIRLPVVEPLGRDRQILRRLRLQRDPAARPEQFLRLASRRRESLPDVERILRVRDAVDRAAQEQAVAPVDRVLAGLDVERNVDEVEVRERERVQPFARHALGVALRVGAQRAGDRQAVDQRVRGRVERVVEVAVGEVVPAGRADAEPVLAAARRGRIRTARRTGW